MHDFTGGNPLFALAMATTMGDGATADLARTQLPESIHAVLDRQLARLDDASRAFLRAASILGSTFEVDLAAQLAGADFEVVENALDLGERNLVVHEQSAGVVHLYEFSHALVAAALTSQLTAIRRRATARQGDGTGGHHAAPRRRPADAASPTTPPRPARQSRRTRRSRRSATRPVRPGTACPSRMRSAGSNRRAPWSTRSTIRRWRSRWTSSSARPGGRPADPVGVS